MLKLFKDKKDPEREFFLDLVHDDYERVFLCALTREGDFMANLLSINTSTGLVHLCGGIRQDLGLNLDDTGTLRAEIFDNNLWKLLKICHGDHK